MITMIDMKDKLFDRNGSIIQGGERKSVRNVKVTNICDK